MTDENELDYLPVYRFFRKCSKCGSNEWSACNLSEDGKAITDCDKCPKPAFDPNLQNQEDAEGEQ